MEAGADKDLRADLSEEGGKTALMFARDRGHLEIARLLVEAGADKDKGDEFSKTALMFACDTGLLDIASLLVQAGA